MKVALLDVKRSLCGYFARVSNDRYNQKFQAVISSVLCINSRIACEYPQWMAHCWHGSAESCNDLKAFLMLLTYSVLNLRVEQFKQFLSFALYRTEKFGVPMPVHLYGRLAKHGVGRDLLQKSRETERLLDILRKTQLPGDASAMRDVKGALYALGHVVAAVDYSKKFSNVLRAQINFFCNRLANELLIHSSVAYYKSLRPVCGPDD